MLQSGSFPMWELISCRKSEKFSSVPLVVWCKFVCHCRSYPLTPLWLTPVWMSPVYSLNKKDLVCYSLLDQENLRKHCTSQCPWLWDERLSCSCEHQIQPLQMYKQKIINSVMMVSSLSFFPPSLSFTFNWQHLFRELVLTYHTRIYLDGSALKAMSARGLSHRPLSGFKSYRVIRPG